MHKKQEPSANKTKKGLSCEAVFKLSLPKFNFEQIKE